MAPESLLHRAAHRLVAQVLEEVARPPVVAGDLQRNHLDAPLLRLLLRLLHEQPSVVLAPALAHHAERRYLECWRPVTRVVALRQPEVPEVAAVVSFEDPELRAGTAKTVPAEAHLHVQQRREPLLEDRALFFGGVAERVELRLQLQRGELDPILRSVRTEAWHGRAC